MPTPLVTSNYLETLPAIDPVLRVILTPASYATWAACLAANPTILDFLLTPGDYTGWGTATIDGDLYADGTALRRRTIRYYNGDSGTHPCRRLNEALVGAFKFQDAANYWHLHGLTQRASTADTTVTSSTDNVFDFMLVEDSTRNYGVRILGGSNRTTVQRCVMRNFELNPIPPTGDRLGVQTFPNNGSPITGIKILDNEFYNLGDGVGCSQNSGDEFIPVDWIIEGNDFYVTSALYFGSGLADTENALDFKTGNDAIQSIVRRNRCWGLRSNGETATGDAFVIHRAARNILFEENIVGNCVRAIHESLWIAFPTGPLDQQTPRNIIFRNNQCYEIHQFNAAEDSAGAGAVVRPANNMLVQNNRIARCDFALYIHTAPQGGGPTLTGNSRASTIYATHPSSYSNPYNEALNSVVAATGQWDVYERKRWTGPEWAIGAIPLDARRRSVPRARRRAVISGPWIRKLGLS